VFEGCWKYDEIALPVSREDCETFEESNQRIDRNYWEKWNWKVYVDGNLVHHEQGVPRGESLPLFKRADEIYAEQTRQQEICEHSSEQLFKRADEIYAKQIAQRLITCEQPTQNDKCCDQHESSDPTSVATNADNNDIGTTSTNTNEKETTRVLILQALANNISKLKDIADFAEVDRSTAHYHLRNLIKEERVVKASWGNYAFSDKNSLDQTGKTFEKLLKNFSHLGGGTGGSRELHPVERNILMDILTKDNKYERFSERELSRKNKISRYLVKKYTEKLEKKKLIIIKREKNQLVYVPTELAVNGLTEFFHVERTGSKSGKESSKDLPVEPVDAEQPIELLDPNQPGPEPHHVLDTFDDYLAWQQKNAHRMIIQFKLLKCNHNRLKGTGWIFGEKRVHKHFDEAYIFKSKDPKGHYINVLPKHPFIFMSPFEFHDHVIDFVNEIIDRLREYGMIIDLTEPAEVKLQHEAIEDDPFARKVIKKGLLYFESKIVTDQTGERINYVIKIDKSNSLHFEFEGPEAHQLTENLEAFVDDVVTGKIDRKKLREIPQQVENLKKEFGKEIQGIEERLDTSIKDIANVQRLLHQNQLDFSQNLTAFTEMVQKVGGATAAVKQAADTVSNISEVLNEAVNSVTKILF
jgi:DNA-binding MarR family transcriptional regulator